MPCTQCICMYGLSGHMYVFLTLCIFFSEELGRPISRKDKGKRLSREDVGSRHLRKRQRLSDSEGEGEAAFESQPRLARWRRGGHGKEEEEEEEVHHLLPLKGRHGELISQPAVPKPRGTKKGMML